jgi:hypothetical protein
MLVVASRETETSVGLNTCSQALCCFEGRERFRNRKALNCSRAILNHHTVRKIRAFVFTFFFFFKLKLLL